MASSPPNSLPTPSSPPSPSPSRSSSSSSSSSPPSPPLPSPPEIHVLAVDDSVLDRKVIEKLLRTSSFKVTTVDSGSKALEFLGINGDQDSVQINISLIITDYCMPGMTGYELLKRVKESSAFKETPVVIMSSENIPTRIEKCLEEGAKEFIMKPVQMSDVERIKAHIRPLSSTSLLMSASSTSLSSSSLSSASASTLAPTYHVDQPSVSCIKRKFDSEGFEAQSPERRPRFSGMIFA